ncbi:hypothetical protein GHT06_007220 [Daphnia sinensis]|uniref:Uncharacterized protein n=1 Tax=Daphnia sinensis TaxID=1820382 RepID=A0AAD5KDW4_9CRUS|nr:hypothetical protein GHT06_007220 [Daphnia sinensis]
MILDSTAAAKAIVKDDIEHFFDSIRPIDMVIQMQNPSVSAHANRDSILTAYKKFVQEDVADFKKDEIEFIAKTLAEAFELCNKAALKYFPEEIKLVKTHGKHYGDDTYYTRENIIVIPKAALKKKNTDEFLKVMLHEISHIITRLNPSVKTSLYALIGFNPIQQPLVMNDSLKQRVLINPDGSDLKWITELTTADGVLKAQKTPIIVSMKSIETTATPKEPNFVGSQIAFDDAKNQVIFKEKAGFKTDKIEVVNAASVIFDRKEMTFKVIDAEKIFTNMKIVKTKTTDKTKVCVDYKLNDDTIYITEFVEK